MNFSSSSRIPGKNGRYENLSNPWLEIENPPRHEVRVFVADDEKTLRNNLMARGQKLCSRPKKKNTLGLADAPVANEEREQERRSKDGSNFGQLSECLVYRIPCVYEVL